MHTCSLRVNLDMGKVLYSWMIQRDKLIPDTIVRTSTIPEELGRIEYLLTDKTGTLTRNEMVNTCMQYSNMQCNNYINMPAVYQRISFEIFSEYLNFFVLAIWYYVAYVNLVAVLCEVLKYVHVFYDRYFVSSTWGQVPIVQSPWER